MKTPLDITDADLRNTYARGDLARFNITFAEATADHTLHTALVCTIRAERERAAQAPLGSHGSTRLEHMTGEAA